MNTSSSPNLHRDKADVIRARIDPELKRQAMAVLDHLGMSVSDLMRETLVRVVQDRAVPFSVRTSKGIIRPETKRTLDAMFLPELHQARWAEELGRLRYIETSTKSPAILKETQAAIAKHYKRRHDLAQTKRALEDSYLPEKSTPARGSQ